MMTEVSEKQTPFVAAIRGWSLGSAPAGPAWLDERRRAARERFLAAGLPGPKEEAWRFTSLKALAKQAFLPAAAPPAGALTAKTALAASRYADEDAIRIVFVNGFHAPGLSAGAGEGIRLESLAASWDGADDGLRADLAGLADDERHRFAALNTAAFADGARVRVAANRDVERPVHLLFITLGEDPPPASHPRVLIQLETGARATVVEEHVGFGPPAGYLVNAVTEVRVGDNASLEHVRLQGEGEKAFHIGTVAAELGRDSRWLSHSVSLGARLARVDIDAVLAGEGGNCVLNGLYLPRGRQHVDHHTHVDHVRPHTASEELYKGVLDGKATGVFNGRVLIREGAQKIEAAQTNNNLLLSSDALVNTNPELEIFADDVKARHGATIGQIEDEHLFYLRSRGIAYDEARKILIRGFVSDMIERITVAPLRKTLNGVVGERF